MSWAKVPEKRKYKKYLDWGGLDLSEGVLFLRDKEDGKLFLLKLDHITGLTITKEWHGRNSITLDAYVDLEKLMEYDEQTIRESKSEFLDLLESEIIKKVKESFSN